MGGIGLFILGSFLIWLVLKGVGAIIEHKNMREQRAEAEEFIRSGNYQRTQKAMETKKMANKARWETLPSECRYLHLPQEQKDILQWMLDTLIDNSNLDQWDYARKQLEKILHPETEPENGPEAGAETETAEKPEQKHEQKPEHKQKQKWEQRQKWELKQK